MTPQFDILIIGSGPSGAHAAAEAIGRGCKAALLDIGYTGNRFDQMIPFRPFSAIRRSDPEQFRYFLGDDPAAVFRNQSRAGVHLTPARQHMIRGMNQLFPIESDTFLPLQATGLGGLGISWGANCFALEDFELERIGIPPGELRSFYASSAREVGISGPVDDCLSPLIANLDHSTVQPPLPLDTNAAKILARYSRNQKRHTANGFYMGQSLLAMLSRDTGDRKANPQFDMDFWADLGRSVYRPRYTIEKLKASPDFTYLPGWLARRFHEEDGFVTVECRESESSTAGAFTARKLLLAAGAINSGRLALASFRDSASRLPILCNTNHWAAAINLPMLGQPARDARHSLSQLTILMKTDLRGPDYVLAQIYSYRSLLMFRLLKDIPLPPRLGLQFLRLIATAFTCINIHFPDYPSPNRWIGLKDASADGVLVAGSEFTDAESEWIRSNESRLLRFLFRLGCIPVGVTKPAHGASIHYAGTLPIDDTDRPLTTSASNRLRGTQNVYVADGSSWRFMPAKGLTLTLMANARRVAAQAVDDLAWNSAIEARPAKRPSVAADVAGA